MAGSGSSAISQARIEVLDETGARETKSRGVLNERALGIGRLIFGWHLPFHVAQIRDARALEGKLYAFDFDPSKLEHHGLDNELVEELRQKLLSPQGLW